MVEEVDGYSVPQTPITPGGASLCSFNSSRSGLNRIPRRRKRESVAKMSFRAAAALVKVRWRDLRAADIWPSHLVLVELDDVSEFLISKQNVKVYCYL